MTAFCTEEIGTLQDSCKGYRLFIVGAGPTIDDVNLGKLKGQYIFALNAAATLFTNPRAFPDAWWVWWDLRACREVYPRVKSTRIQSLVHKKGLEELRVHRGTGRFVHYRHQNQFKPRRTVAETAILLGDFLGFEEAILVGVDGLVGRNGRAYCDAVASWKSCYFCNPTVEGSWKGSSDAFVSAMALLMPSIRMKVRTTSDLYPGDEFERISYEEAVALPPPEKDEETEKRRRQGQKL